MPIRWTLYAGRRAAVLNTGNYHRRDHVPYVRQSVAEATAESLRADGDSKGDEDDEHGVFGGCGAALVPVEAVDQSEHLTVSAKCRARLIHHIPSLTCPIGRQKGGKAQAVGGDDDDDASNAAKIAGEIYEPFGIRATVGCPVAGQAGGGRFQQPICETVTDAAAARAEGSMYAHTQGP